MVNSDINQTEHTKATRRLFLSLLATTLVGLLFATSEPMQWFLVFANILVVFSVTEIRLDWRLAALFIGAIFLRESLSFYNDYITLLPSADMDSTGFQVMGCTNAQKSGFELHLGSEFFTQFLAFWYRLFGCSGFLTMQFSILAMTGFGIALLKIIRLLSLDDHQYSILFFALYLPSHILFPSLNLREPYQLFFFTLAIFFILRLRILEWVSFKGSFFLFLICIALLGVMHNGLMFFSVVILLPFALLLCLRKMQSLHKILLMGFLTFLMLPLLIYFSQHNIRGSQVLTRVLTGEIVQYVNYYRDHLPLGRTQYIAKFDFTSLPALIGSTANIVFHFWFEPFPSRVESFADLIVFVEVQCYALMLLGSLYLWWHAKGEAKIIISFLLALYLSISLLWAAGTGNVGTAIRHQILETWIIILLGIPGIYLWGKNTSAALYRIITSTPQKDFNR